MPVAPTVATPGVIELHVPPGVASVSAVVLPIHTIPLPLMVPALPEPQNNEIRRVAVAVPQPFVML